MAKLFTIGAGTYLFLVLLKDGSATRLVQDGANGTKDLFNGLKNLTRNA